jgi:hypothetical protein
MLTDETKLAETVARWRNAHAEVDPRNREGTQNLSAA